MRQPGLFGDCDEPPAPPLAFDATAAYDFYRRVIAEPAVFRATAAATHGRPVHPPAAADWYILAAVLLRDRHDADPARERPTVLVGSYEAGVRYEVARKGGVERVRRELDGRFLVLCHSALGLTVTARLVSGRELRAGGDWAGDVARHFAGGRSRKWQTTLPWESIARRGERVFSTRDGLLRHPLDTEHQPRT